MTFWDSGATINYRMRFNILFVALVLTLSFYLSSCNFVLAQTPIQSGQITTEDELITSVTDPGAVEMGESLISPNSPLYFLKTIREGIEIAMSSSAEAKVNRQLEFAQRRLREIKSLVKGKNQDLIPPTIERYNLFIEKAFEAGRADSELQIKVGEALARHLDVLQRVYDQVGNPRAKQAVRAALIKSSQHNRELVEKLEVVPQQRLIKKIASRQAFACKFLIRESTSSGLNDTEKEQVREKVAECRQESGTYLKDELSDQHRRSASPSSIKR